MPPLLWTDDTVCVGLHYLLYCLPKGRLVEMWLCAKAMLAHQEHRHTWYSSLKVCGNPKNNKKKKKRELLDQMKKKRHAEDKCSESQRGFLVRAAVVASLVSVQALLAVCSRFTEIKLYRKIAQNK